MERTAEQLAQSAVGLIGEVNRKLGNRFQILKLEKERQHGDSPRTVWLQILNSRTGDVEWWSHHGYTEKQVNRDQIDKSGRHTFCQRWWKLLDLTPEEIEQVSHC